MLLHIKYLGFEPTQAMPNRFRVYRLNHSTKAIAFHNLKLISWDIGEKARATSRLLKMTLTKGESSDARFEPARANPTYVALNSAKPTSFRNPKLISRHIGHDGTCEEACSDNKSDKRRVLDYRVRTYAGEPNRFRFS